MDRKRRLWTFRHRRQKSRIVDARNFHPHAQRIAHFRLSVLKTYHKKISKRERSKGEIFAEIIALYNAGLILPDVFRGKPKYLSRSAIYNWDKLYKDGGFLALIPKYRWKPRPGAAVIPIRPFSRIKKIVIPGPPRRRAKYEFLPQLSLQWKGPPLVCPIHLAIFYGIGIRKGTKMRRRMKMLKDQISHVGIPNLDSLNSFLVDCMAGIVFKDHSQIVEFYCLKKYMWCPKTIIYIRALPR
jgi:Holliday junction resolvase RusA-like endonuclease